MAFVSRNAALGFAQRTRKNLKYIEAACQDGADVHPITQLGVSLLGLVVFPHEKHFFDHVENLALSDLADRGWPTWTFTCGVSATLGELVRHVRNAAAHGLIEFSSESHDMSEVTITVRDRPKDKAPFNWEATILAEHLREFVLLMIQLIENTLG